MSENIESSNKLADSKTTQLETKESLDSPKQLLKKRKEPEPEDLLQEQVPPEPIEIRQVKMPKIQYAQKCAWCRRYLFYDEEVRTYDGDDPDYQGWMVHDSCNLNPIREDY